LALVSFPEYFFFQREIGKDKRKHTDEGLKVKYEQQTHVSVKNARSQTFIVSREVKS